MRHCPLKLEIFIGRFAFRVNFIQCSGLITSRIILRFFASFEKFLAENRESIEMKQIPSILCPSHRCENE